MSAIRASVIYSLKEAERIGAELALRALDMAALRPVVRPPVYAGGGGN